MINLAADLSYTRAIDESTYTDVNNYRVSLYKGETAIFQNQLYSDLELTQEGKLLYERGQGLLAMARGTVQAVSDCRSAQGGTLRLRVDNPRRWDTQDPYLYTLSVTLLRDGEAVTVRN